MLFNLPWIKRRFLYRRTHAWYNADSGKRGNGIKNARIRVLKVTFDPDLAERYLTDGKRAGPCPYFQAGDTFVYEGGAKMPEGFCPWAWVDIYTNASALAAGGTYAPWNNSDGESVACCTDGIRPVSFELKAL